MRRAGNPFTIRRSESIDGTATFLDLFEPGVLEILDGERWCENVHIIRSARGGGKTSLLRLFTPGVLNHLQRRSREDSLKELHRSLRELGALDDSRVIANAHATGRRDVLLLVYDGKGGPSGDPTLSKDANGHVSEMRELFAGIGQFEERPMRLYADDGRRVASQRAGEFIAGATEFELYTDVVLDVSGMPRSIFFPLIARMLYILDSGRRDGHSSRNLFILVAEDPDLDAAITPRDVEEFADFVAMFRGSFDQEAHANLPAVWMPVLGEGRLIQLQRIYDLVKPDEICPVLPSPARNPRRADDLVLEYREFFFGEHGLDPRDFDHASEDNPFDVYRRLRAAVHQYEHALETLRGCRIAFSALSSKLMSLGVILAAYEAKQAGSRIGIAHVDSHGYQIGATRENSELYGLWIAGECYG